MRKLSVSILTVARRILALQLTHRAIAQWATAVNRTELWDCFREIGIEPTASMKVALRRVVVKARMKEITKEEISAIIFLYELHRNEASRIYTVEELYQEGKRFGIEKEPWNIILIYKAMKESGMVD